MLTLPPAVPSAVIESISFKLMEEVPETIDTEPPEPAPFALITVLLDRPQHVDESLLYEMAPPAYIEMEPPDVVGEDAVMFDGS